MTSAEDINGFLSNRSFGWGLKNWPISFGSQHIAFGNKSKVLHKFVIIKLSQIILKPPSQNFGFFYQKMDQTGFLTKQKFKLSVF